MKTMIEKLTVLKSVADKLIVSLQKLGVWTQGHPSSSTVGDDIKSFLRRGVSERQQTLTEMGSLLAEASAILNTDGIGTSVIAEFAPYIRSLGRLTGNPDEASRNEAGEYGLRFKTSLATIHETLESVGI